MFGNYYSSMDRDYGIIEPSDIPSAKGVSLESSSLGPKEIGTTTNPMANQVQGFNEKIREGASKIEISFIGQGKTNAQQPGPEAFGHDARTDIRELAQINDIRTSVHASWHQGSLAGLGREGFTEEARKQAVKEIEKAINFAAEATTGGAVVFHTGEWARPMTDIKDKLFRGYDYEEEKAPMMVVDSRTGDMSAIRKDQYVYEPTFLTAEKYQDELGRQLVGTIDKYGNKIEADDWVDINGNAIKRSWMFDSEKTKELFNRMPVWNPDDTDFEVTELKYDDFVERAKRLKQEGIDVTPEVLFFKTQLSNQVLQAKGSSLYHARFYESQKEGRDALVKALDFYEKLEDNMSEEEKWKLTVQTMPGQGYDSFQGLVPPKNMLPSEFLRKKIKSATDEMRYTHEASAASDAQARQALERMNRTESIEDYGLNKTAETIATVGLKAMKYTKANKDHLKEDLYVAPENWRTEEFGSHPDEIRKIINVSRAKMEEQLVKREGYSEEEAKKLAKNHIKATLDIGHLNLWRQHFIAKDGESPKDRDKRFETWALKETEKLAKEGIVGHVHLSDNFGYDDEHVTPGEGNVPIREFVKNMEKAGLKDFIAEAGSYNAKEVMTDTWALLGSPIYGSVRMPTFRSMNEQHFGYHNPLPYIVGAYAPSNEWKLWTEVPLE